MLYIISFVNMLKNLVVKLWSIKPIRILACVALAYYLGEGFYTKVMSRASTASFEFLGMDTIFKMPQYNYNSSFMKSNKVSGGVSDALSTLASVYGPGLVFVGIILFLQKVWNTYKAPPLPIVFNNENADEVLVRDYTLPVLYTKRNDWDDEVEEEENTVENQQEGVPT